MTDSGRPASRAAIADFLEMLAAERGAAKNTLDAYARDLGDYVLGLARRGRDPMTATIQDIRDYLSALAEAGLKPTSSARKLSAIRQFHRFLAAEERRPDDPAVLLEGPRQGRRLPKILSIAEVDSILRVCREGLDDPARPAGRAVAGAPRRLSGRGALRVGPARVGTGGVDPGRGETGRKAARNRAAASSPFAARAAASASRP